jgi:hypothetical protein
MAPNVEVEVQQGGSQGIVVTLRDRTGAPIPSFANWRARAEVRYAPKGLSPLLWYWDSAEGSLELVGGADSHALLKMPAPEISLAWTWRLAWFDVTTLDQNGDPAGRPVRGLIRVIPAVTQSMEVSDNG